MKSRFTFHHNIKVLFAFRVLPFILAAPILLIGINDFAKKLHQVDFLFVIFALFGPFLVASCYLYTSSICVDDEEICKRLFWIKWKSVKWSDVGAVCLETHYTRNGSYKVCAIYKAPFIRQTVNPYKAGSLVIDFFASIKKFETLSALIGNQAKLKAFPLFKLDRKVTETLQESNGSYSLFPKLEPVEALQPRKSLAD